MAMFDDDDSYAGNELDALSAQWGVPLGETDQANFAAKNPEDRAAFVQAIGQQLQQRASNPTGGGQPDTVGISAMLGGQAPQSIKPFTETFQAPDPANTATNAAFKFRLDNAMKAIRRNGLARGDYGTNRTDAALQEQAAGIAGQAYNDDFSRSLAGYTTRRDTAWGNEGQRFSSERTNRLDDFGIGDSNRQFARTLSNDQWGRGQDVWNMNRTDRNDAYGQNLSVADLILRNYPRPA